MPDPKYRQIADDLIRRIESGELGKDGEALPSEKELEAHYKASRNTIRDAIDRLATRRLVETRPPQGTFVVKINPFVIFLDRTNGFGGESAAYASEVEAINRKATVSDPKIEIQQATTARVARELELASDATVLSRHQQRFIDGVAWSLQTTFYPMTLVQRLVERGATRLIEAQDIPEGAVKYLEEHLGIKQLGFRDELKVRPPDDNETQFFDLPEDGSVAVFETRRIGFEKEHVPLRLTVTIFPSDRNKFVFDVGDVPERPKISSHAVIPDSE
jgi:GntR family transcriptional regulator